MSRDPVEEQQRRHGSPASRLLADLDSHRDASGRVGPDGEVHVAATQGLPVAAIHGSATYFADLTAPVAARHVRVCAGTACFVASGGGRHLAEVEQALGVRAGERSADGAVSLQRVRCLGYCYGGPAALDGTAPRAGPDLAAQLRGDAAPVDPPVPVSSAGEPVVLRRILDRPALEPWAAWRSVLIDGGPERVLREVGRAGLTGRGGAGFPAARKWEAVRRSRGTGPAYVVGNGDEGDPGSYADRLLMERDPVSVLEGLALAGIATGAQQGFVFVRSEYPQAVLRLREAVAAAQEAGHLGTDIYGTGTTFDVDVVVGAGSYVAGEETSLLHALSGLRGTVRSRPPYPTQRGLLGRPTAVNNVETLSAVAHVVGHGADSFASRGVRDETGTLVVCLSERFARPGAYEVDIGTPTRVLVEEIGGGLRDGGRLRALQVGGPLGGFIGSDDLDVPLSATALAERGAAVGHGSLVAIDDGVFARDLLQHLWDFAAEESCGMCTPCRVGTRRGLRLAEDGRVDTGLLDLMESASLCAFGKGIAHATRNLYAAFGEAPV